jgi:hypothetical protein
LEFIGDRFLNSAGGVGPNAEDNLEFPQSIDHIRNAVHEVVVGIDLKIAASVSLHHQVDDLPIVVFSKGLEVRVGLAWDWEVVFALADYVTSFLRPGEGSM